MDSTSFGLKMLDLPGSVAAITAEIPVGTGENDVCTADAAEFETQIQNREEFTTETAVNRIDPFFSFSLSLRWFSVLHKRHFDNSLFWEFRGRFPATESIFLSEKDDGVALTDGCHSAGHKGRRIVNAGPVGGSYLG